MRTWRFALVVSIVLSLQAREARAQPSPPPPPVTPSAPATLPPPSANARAATVNGEALPELAVHRALIVQRVPKEHHAQARAEILAFLLDNLLVDQYLRTQRVEVASQEIDDQLAQLKKEAKEKGQEFEKLLQEVMLTEAELRLQVTAELRWEKFLQPYTTEAALSKFFEENREWFDGSQVRARHVLVATKATDDSRTREAARTKATQIKAGIENQMAQEMAKVPADTDNLVKESTRVKLLTDLFAAYAKNYSDCPSKERSGDLGAFPRVGVMVEPFARTAFSTPANQVSDVVETQFGYHVILITGRDAGKAIEFKNVKDFVKQAQSDKIRGDIVNALRRTAKVEIYAPMAP